MTETTNSALYHQYQTLQSLKKTMQNRMLKFPDKHETILEIQYGAILHMAKTQPVMAIFLDLQKAFDTVNHK